MLTRLDLPPLTADEARHSAAVVAHIRAELDAAGGWIPFSRYMELALYAPGLGYYSAGAHKLGAAGDFVTAPELTPLFARCLATQAAEVLRATGGGDVLEFGAGSGALATDLLAALERHEALPGRYRILEVSAELRERQRATLSARLPALAARVEWLDALPREPWRGVVIANEVMDALPCERFRVASDRFECVGVVHDGHGFAWQPRPAGEPLAAALAHLTQALPAPLPAGYESELCPALGPWVTAAGERLERGALLLVDYGLPRAQLYHASRVGGSLTCYFRHRQVEDPFVNVGLQDITAWVDFTAVAEAGVDAGLAVAGFATQAHFLAATGLDRELAREFESQDPRGRVELARRASTLVLPGEMGERMKVIALARGLTVPLSGFSFRDQAASL
jgi:SAM-dependent MidA family methyltransferase